MVDPYIPDAGEIVWLSLDPQRGREQSGRRPFLVLSPRAYNSKTSLVAGVPITSEQKGYPFEVRLTAKSSISGVILADQIKSLDWHARGVKFAQQAPPAVLRRVRRLLATFLNLAP